MLWKCSVCGMVVQGEKAPDFCPKCGSPADKYIQLSNDEADKIIVSDPTNDIHMKIIKKCADIVALCDEGIRLNLDPPCVSCFEKAKDEAWIMKQRCKAEIAGHVGKGKW